jgi:hypothetical protein
MFAVSAEIVKGLARIIEQGEDGGGPVELQFPAALPAQPARLRRLKPSTMNIRMRT